MFEFEIPEDTEGGVASMLFEFDVNGKLDKKVEALVVVSEERVTFAFVPESGFFVRGVSNKVYFEAFADESLSDNADVRWAEVVTMAFGAPLEAAEVVVLRVDSEAHGRGSFEFIPEEDKQYYLRTTGISGKQRLSPILDSSGRESTVAIHAEKAVIGSDELAVFDVNRNKSDGQEKYILVVQNKANVLCTREVFFAEGQTHVMVSVEEIKHVSRGGLVTAILYSETPEKGHGFPFLGVGEVSVFVQPSQRIGLSLMLGRPEYTPGEEVQYAVHVDRVNAGIGQDETVLVGITVVDESPFLEVPKKKLSGGLATQVFVEKEVQRKRGELPFAPEYVEAVYGKETNGENARKLETLLGMQEWRKLLLDAEVISRLRDNWEELSDDKKDLYKTFYGREVSYPIMMFAMAEMAMAPAENERMVHKNVRQEDNMMEFDEAEDEDTDP